MIGSSLLQHWKTIEILRWESHSPLSELELLDFLLFPGLVCRMHESF